jgi:glycerate-2-kinase
MRNDARKILAAAINAVQPAALIQHAVKMNGNELIIGGMRYDLKTRDNIYVVAAGKAAASMAAAMEDILGGYLTGGLAVTKYEHGLNLKRINCIESGHPVPDVQGVLAAQQIIEIAKKAEKNDLFIFLLSGGASALVADLPEGIGLEDMMKFSRLLLHSGADIHELNIIRKHLSVLKGGQLSRILWPATLICLAISDVSGDVPGSIGSGPAVPDDSTFADAWRVIEKYQLENEVPRAIMDHLTNGKAGLIPETPKPGEHIFSRTYFQLIGNNDNALKTAANAAEALGYHSVIIQKQFMGDAAAEALSLMARAVKYSGPLPVCMLAGGESTVSVKGTGKGGRNQHMALSVLHQWASGDEKLPGLLFLASATDGSDGPTDAAGGMVDEQFVQEVRRKNINVEDYLINNDSYHFFLNTDMHIITGPTQTNVMDIVILLKTESISQLVNK